MLRLNLRALWTGLLLFALHGVVGSASANEAESCLRAAANHHQVDYLLLVAIAQVESSMNPGAVGKNTNGTADRGLMQINDWWLPKLSQFGVNRQDLMDPCVSAYVGAWILSHEIARHGSTWRAVGAYNSPTARNQQIYADKVRQKLIRMTSNNQH